MGILNSIPGVLIRGENFNLCAGLFRAWSSLVQTKLEPKPKPMDSTHPFFGADVLDEKAFLQDAHALLRSQILAGSSQPIKCWGFKEIRYTGRALNSAGVPSLAQYLDFFSKLFPRSAFIFLTRAHENVLRSAFWNKTEKEKSRTEINAFEQEARTWSKLRADTFWIDYENVIRQDPVLVDLFRFLGAQFDSGRVSAVLRHEHSYGGRDENLQQVKRRDNMGSLAVVSHQAPDLLVATLDRLPTALRPDATFEVSGVLIPGPDTSIDAPAVQIDGSQTRPDIEQQQPSPWYGKQYPNYPPAAHARFTVRGLQFGASRRIAILHSRPSADGRLLFELVLE